jgi:hypothetical protein
MFIVRKTLFRGSVRSARLAAVGAGIFASLTTSARAVEIWAIDNLGPLNAGTNGDRLIRFDSSDPIGTVTVVGETGVHFPGVFFMSGMDVGPDGTLYCISLSDYVPSSLYRLNTSTGAATLLGPLGVPLSVEMNDLSYNPATGQMLGVALVSQPYEHRLYEIDLQTGAASVLGQITGLGQFPGLVGLASNAAGVSFVHDYSNDRMYVLDGLNATPMPQPIGVDTHYSQGMVINWRGNDEWYLGAFGPQPVFPFPPTFSDVRLINSVTGATKAVLGTWPTQRGSERPMFELGDLAILPEPVAGGVAGLLPLATARRRRCWPKACSAR